MYVFILDFTGSNYKTFIYVENFEAIKKCMKSKFEQPRLHERAY